MVSVWQCRDDFFINVFVKAKVKSNTHPQHQSKNNFSFYFQSSNLNFTAKQKFEVKHNLEQ